ncbi:MAG: hypothetical protein NC548_31580 [Lachnospiraceae bacterium]|nr:hypothetical protein [Lachnospiraceae bacterium]
MKRLLPLIAIMLLFVSCGKSDLDKANELIAQKGLNVEAATSLDSLNSYSDCLEMRIKAAKITHEADSTLAAGIESAEQMKANEQTDVLPGFAKRLQEDVVAMYRVAYKYTQDANFNQFQHSLAKDPIEFLGYQCKVSNDSLSYIVAFDPEITKILMVEKVRK